MLVYPEDQGTMDTESIIFKMDVVTNVWNYHVGEVNQEDPWTSHFSQIDELQVQREILPSMVKVENN